MTSDTGGAQASTGHEPRQATGAAAGYAVHLALLLCVIAVTVWSWIEPKDRFTWWLEAIPAVIAMGLLPLIYRRFRMTTLAYSVIALHAIVLLVGAHYTYAEVPLGDWVRDTFGLARNHYDRLGHLMQGFAPAIVAREILSRRSPLAGSRWLPVLVVCFCLAFSAFYEMIEWWVAVASGDGSVAFLGTQGDVWDTQWDMFLALVGASTAVTLLGRVHDRQLARL